MPIIQRPSQSRKTLCCTVEQAASWLDCLAELALIFDDDDAARALPNCVDHYLAALRQVGVTR